MNIYIGESVEVSDMQGPCPYGFHVPLITEWQAIYNAFTGLGLSGVTNFLTYLKIPSAGGRSYSNANFSNRGSRGYYWSSNTNGVSDADMLSISSSSVSTSNGPRSYGRSVRGIKNTPVTPTSSWTKLYGTSIESGGIFHNSTDGIISISSDGTTWYTLMDKNLGATTVYNYGDTLTEANCGKIYQRGNNYGFSGDENYDVSQISKSSTQVNVTGYGPGNYYESSTWVTQYTWQSSANNGDNLWGGVSQGTSTEMLQKEVKNIYIGEYVPDFATRGPAPSGFHVPLDSDWQAIYNTGASLGAWTSSNGTNFSTYLKIPMAGIRSYNTNTVVVGSYGYYWSSSPNLNNYETANVLSFYSNNINTQDLGTRSGGFYVRCLKDSPVTPTSSWTVLKQGTGGAGIFHNTTDGLISISSDGTTWYTIMDKNLGAITVYNYGDTLTDANCGNVFQRGNNYPFPGTLSSASITRSSTRVNASTYGPGNYYESSTWISYSGNWDSSNNNNLRGGVDGNVPVV